MGENNTFNGKNIVLSAPYYLLLKYNDLYFNKCK